MLNFQPFGKGLHIIKVEATDLAGNVNSDSVNVTYTTNYPWVFLTIPQNGTLNGMTISEITALLGSDYNIGINFNQSTIQLFNSSGLISNAGTLQSYGNVQLTLQLNPQISPLSQGNYTIEVTPVDILGRSKKFTYKFYVDTNSPQIIMLSPTTTGQIIRNPQTYIAAIMKSKSQITSANLTLNNGSIINVLSYPNNGTIFFNKSFTLIEGKNNFTIVSTSELSTYPGIYNGDITLRTMGPTGIVTIED